MAVNIQNCCLTKDCFFQKEQADSTIWHIRDLKPKDSHHQTKEVKDCFKEYENCIHNLRSTMAENGDTTQIIKLANLNRRSKHITSVSENKSLFHYKIEN